MPQLKISYFAKTSDSNVQMHIYRTKDELTKNLQEENTASGRMYYRDDKYT